MWPSGRVGAHLRDGQCLCERPTQNREVRRCRSCQGVGGRPKTQPAQAYEPEVPVKVREWIGPVLASPDLVLEAQPPAQPHSCVVVERPICFADGAYLEVVRPSAQRTVQLAHQLCGLLPCR